MLHADVIGSVTSSVKHASMTGCKLLLVQPLAADGKTPDGDPQLAIDSQGAGKGHLGAGQGMRVVITSDGKTTREILGDETTPVRWCVLGVCD